MRFVIVLINGHDVDDDEQQQQQQQQQKSGKIDHGSTSGSEYVSKLYRIEKLYTMYLSYISHRSKTAKIKLSYKL